MNVAILEANDVAQIIKNNLDMYSAMRREQGEEEIKTIAFVKFTDNNPPECFNDVAVISLRQFQTFYRKNIINKLILPRETFSGQTELLSHLMSLHIDPDDVYLTGRIENESIRTIEPYMPASYLPYLEFHIADHCNLNCRGCEHYSGLVKSPHFPNFDRFERDMIQLHKFINDIGVIRILGGEPLLNPEINRYIELNRRLYPQSTLFVVTNALLLPKMPNSFFETLLAQKAMLFISYYLPLQSKMQSIRQMLHERGVPYFLTQLNEQFSIKQTLRPHNQPHEMFLHCHQAHCHNLYEGKLAACFLPFTTKYFNEYFGKNLPEDGAIDLYDPTMTTHKLKALLNTPFERCRYCTPPVMINWSTIKKPSTLSDWVNDEL